MDATNGSPVPVPEKESSHFLSRSQEKESSATAPNPVQTSTASPSHNEASNSGNLPSTKPKSVERYRLCRPRKEGPLNCPRCNSTNTKFSYYNNYSLNQPRYFCKTCRRYWTQSGSFGNLPPPPKNKSSFPNSSFGATKKPPSSSNLVDTAQSPESSNTNAIIAAVIESFNTGFDLQALKPTALALSVWYAYDRSARAAAGTTGVDGVSVTVTGSDQFEPNKGQLGEADQNQPNQLVFQMINLDEEPATDN